MQKLLSLAAIVAVTPVLCAQHCTGVPPATSLATNVPFSATHYMGSPNPVAAIYNGPVYFIDVTVEATLLVSQIDCYLYDDGLVNPNQVGATTTTTVYSCANSRVGNELIDPASPGSPWSSLGTGTLTVQDSDSHSPIVFNPPLVLSPGTYGLAIAIGVTNTGLGTQPGSLHPLIVLPTVVPNTPLQADDQYLHIFNESASRNAWQAGVGGFRTENLEFHYTPDPNSAFSETYGVGCYDNAPAYYEYFQAPPAAFDLSNRSLHQFPLTVTQLITPGTGTYTAPTGTATLLPGATTTQMGDDDVSPPQTLPFTFSWPGGAGTNQIVVGSNGHIWLSGVSGGTFGFYDNTNGFLTGGARLAPCYGDWNPDPATNGGVVGGVYYEADPGNQFVTIWWHNIPEWVPTPPATGVLNCKCQIFATGEVEYSWGTVAMQNAPVLVGFTPGTANVSDPGSRNLSTIYGPPTGSFQTGDGFQPPFLALNLRPVLGRTVQIETRSPNVPVAFNLLLLSFAEIPGGIDLSYINPSLAGCRQWIGLAGLSSNGTLSNNGLAQIPLTIPNLLSLSGVTVHCQTAIICGCQNAAGIVVSNGMCLKVAVN
jgi:hypothetical protein